MSRTHIGITIAFRYHGDEDGATEYLSETESLALSMPPREYGIDLKRLEVDPQSLFYLINQVLRIPGERTEVQVELAIASALEDLSQGKLLVDSTCNG
ncbi:MAG TPA: hypothetical protein PKA37_15620 [Planctomycetota bacterium]|nr:hypothetical protein [Planctomycetota bacterium]